MYWNKADNQKYYSDKKEKKTKPKIIIFWRFKIILLQVQLKACSHCSLLYV